LPVNRVYAKIDEESTLKTIKKDLNEVPGIYAIIHNETKKLYIGSSINLAKRIFEHVKNIRSSNLHLQRAIEKYGLNNFSVYVLELLPAWLRRKRGGVKVEKALQTIKKKIIFNYLYSESLKPFRASHRCRFK
jgi:group I intron endonuclease